MAKIYALVVCAAVLGSYLQLVSANCSDPGDSQNAARAISSATFEVNSTVTYTCLEGYEVNDGSGDTNYTRECEDDDKWSGSPQDCEKVSCGSPTELENATYSDTSFLYSDYVTYTCNPGYRFLGGFGSTTVVINCQSDKTWNEQPEDCKKVMCVQPEVIPFADQTAPNPLRDEYFLGDSIGYMCQNGYYKDAGDYTLTCGEDRFWVGTWPVCKTIKCTDPGMVEHTSRTVSGGGLGAELTYKCVTGYEHDGISGPLTRQCREDGSWTGDQQPACRGVYCGIPYMDPNIVINPTSPTYRHPETVEFTCNEGYRSDYSGGGVNYITCTRFATWDFKPINCTRIRCSESTYPVNTEIDNTVYYYGETKTLQCIRGHALVSGELVRVCQANGTFEYTAPVCQRLICDEPADDPHANHTETGFSYRDVYTYTCHPGYEVQGEINVIRKSVICKESRLWEPAIKPCAPVSCRSPSLGQGIEILHQEGTSFGDVVRFHCVDGYEPYVGDMIRKCQENKRWNGTTPHCQRKSCGEPAHAPNANRIGQQFRVGNDVFFICDSGYEMTSGDDKLTCSDNGQWIGTVPTCERVKCSAPDAIPFSTWTSAQNITQFYYEDLVTYSCNEGYTWLNTSGPLNRTCAETRRWSGRRPICEPQSCGDPGKFPGTYKLGLSHRYLDVVNYTCATGYEAPTGKSWSVVNCNINGTWEGDWPNCQAVYCGDPGMGNFTYRNGTDFYYKDELTYTCHANYYIATGSNVIKCTEAKTWNFPVPDCIPIPEIKGLSSPGKDNTSAVEAEDSLTYGYICIGIMAFEAAFCVILDLLTISKDIHILKRNLGFEVAPKNVSSRSSSPQELSPKEQQLQKRQAIEAELERKWRAKVLYLENMDKLENKSKIG